MRTVFKYKNNVFNIDVNDEDNTTSRVNISSPDNNYKFTETFDKKYTQFYINYYKIQIKEIYESNPNNRW